MGSSMCLLISMRLLFFSSIFHYLNCCSSLSTQPVCKDFESSALLQLKQSLEIDVSASFDPFAYPKISSWNSGERNDCCSWDGVLCDRGTGYVIGLDLSSSQLYGSFNSSSSLFHLVYLQKLNLADNDFNYSQIPPSIRYLSNLTYINLSMSAFSGQIPPEIFELSNLVSLDLSFNPLKLQNPGLLANLPSLKSLDLSSCGLYGDIPMSLKNLTQLTQFLVHNNQLTGQIPPWLGNLTQLTDIDLSEFHSKYLSGRVELDLLLNKKKLTILLLSGFHLSFPINSTFNTSTPKLKILALNACNLTEFPIFLHSQQELKILSLANNKIQGQIPNWLFNMGKQTLFSLDLSHNFLTNFESFNHSSPPILPWDNLLDLDLSSNKLQGSLPIPPPSIAQYNITNNKLTGEISPLFCNLSSIEILDLSHNNLGGMLPKCLSNLSDLVVLNLQSNNFRGILPGIYMEQSRLKAIDVSYNQLEGQVPRSLSNCTMLEILLLGNNRLSDIFSSWLGKLPRLRVLSLQSNGFHSAIGKPESSLDFPKLQIIDVSFNNFTGKLPYEHFQSWTSMKVANLTFDEDNAYMVVDTSTPSPYSIFVNDFSYTLEMTNKGIKTLYQKIQDHLVAIDLSSNKFDGEISEVIGNLKGPHLLNVSNNMLTGPIPSSLENLMELESLDLSQNRLSGDSSAIIASHIP
ncbi:hypothetical protein ACB098_03G065600 [Castanea mollissima]